MLLNKLKAKQFCTVDYVWVKYVDRKIMQKNHLFFLLFKGIFSLLPLGKTLQKMFTEILGESFNAAGKELTEHHIPVGDYQGGRDENVGEGHYATL